MTIQLLAIAGSPFDEAVSVSSFNDSQASI